MFDVHELSKCSNEFSMFYDKSKMCVFTQIINLVCSNFEFI